MAPESSFSSNSHTKLFNILNRSNYNFVITCLSTWCLKRQNMQVKSVLGDKFKVLKEVCGARLPLSESMLSVMYKAVVVKMCCYLLFDYSFHDFTFN